MINKIIYLFNNLKTDKYFSIYTIERGCNSIHVTKKNNFYLIEFEFGGIQTIQTIDELFDIIGNEMVDIVAE